MAKLTHTIELRDYREGMDKLFMGLNKTEDEILREVLEEHLGFKPTEAEIRKCTIVQWNELPKPAGDSFFLRRYTFLYENTTLGQMDITKQSHSLRCQFFHNKKA